MKVTDIDLRKMLDFDTSTGRVLFGKERMLLFRQDALAMLRRLLRDQLGEELYKAILFQFGWACGNGDYKSLSTQFDWDSEQDKVASGPVLHTWEGICRSESQKMDFDHATGHFHHIGLWHNSYEAEIHLKEFGLSDEAVCWTLTGYASGYLTAFFGSEILAIERKCMGKGDEICQVEAKPLKEWGEDAEPWKRALTSTHRSLTRELEEKIAVINRQAVAISEMATPVMEIWDDILVLPIVGIIDTNRSMDIMSTLLEQIAAKQSKCVIIDITGVEVVDTRTADYLVKVVRAATLLGTRCVMTGLSPAIAQTLVEIGVDLREILTLRNLKEGLKDCLRYIDSIKGVRAHK